MIDPVLTSMLLAGAALWSALVYPLMRRQLKVVDRMLQGRAAYMEESRALSQLPRPTMPETMRGAGQHVAAAIGRRHVMNDMALVLQLGVTVLGTLAALYLAYRIIGGAADWPIFIVYLGLLRIALNGAFVAPKTFGTVSRFYPRLVVFIQFVQDAARIDGDSLGSVTAGDAVLLGSLPNGDAITARGGDRIALATLAPPLIVQAAFLQARVAESGRPLAAGWLAPAGAGNDGARDATIRLVAADMLAALEPREAQAFLHGGPSDVTMIVHDDETSVGAFGEEHLLVIDGDAFMASAPIGTAESRAALASFAAARERTAAAAQSGRAASAVEVGVGDEAEE